MLDFQLLHGSQRDRMGSVLALEPAADEVHQRHKPPAAMRQFGELRMRVGIVLRQPEQFLVLVLQPVLERFTGHRVEPTVDLDVAIGQRFGLQSVAELTRVRQLTVRIRMEKPVFAVRLELVPQQHPGVADEHVLIPTEELVGPTIVQRLEMPHMGISDLTPLPTAPTPQPAHPSTGPTGSTSTAHCSAPEHHTDLPPQLQPPPQLSLVPPPEPQPPPAAPTPPHQQ